MFFLQKSIVSGRIDSNKFGWNYPKNIEICNTYNFFMIIYVTYGDFTNILKKYFAKVLFINFFMKLQNENRLTYGEFGKYWKTHEITMKYGNFIHVFLVKTCSIIVVRKTYMGMVKLRGFSFCFLFCLKVYWHFVCWVLYCVGPSSFFLTQFFFVLQRYVSKNGHF